MDNQHRQIKGYGDLSEKEIALMNEIKAKGQELELLADRLMTTEGLDGRWLALGITDLQKGLMALTRAVAQPTTF